MKSSTIKNVSIDKSKFVVLTKLDTGEIDWILESKFLDICSLLDSSKSAVKYPLKNAIKGNEDEGRKSQTGKALRVIKDNDIIKVEVFHQNYGEGWKLHHKHIITSNVFESYRVVIQNNLDVLQAEKDAKKPKNFSLNLSL